MPLAVVSATDATVQTVRAASTARKNLLLGFYLTYFSTAAGTIVIKSGSTVLITLQVAANTNGVFTMASTDLWRWDNLIAANEALTVTGATNVTYSGNVLYQDFSV